VTQEGFEILFEEYFEEIRRYIFFRSGDAALSTDIAQETFLKVWEKQMDLEPGKDAALLYRIAGNLLISHYRREKVARKAQNEMDLELKQEDAHDIHYRELKESYKRALMRMPEKQRVVFMMSRMDQLSYREIAERLDIGIKAVEKRMNRALKFLRTELDMK
jgi:RNA polymerase sigma-70 factor (ECF subfamily)